MSEMRQIVCGHCGRTNRLPAERAPNSARCGACHQPIFTGHPIEVDEDGFERHVAGNDIPVLVDVWAPWCGPCQMMGPQFAAAAQRLEPGVRLLKLNAEAEPQAAGELHVSGVPALILFRDGRPIARQAGAMTAGQIVAWATQALARAPA